MNSIPFYRSQFTEDEIAGVVDVLKSGWLTTGKQARAFENEIAEYVGSAGALALNSCTAALHLALVGRGIGPGDEVISTPLTFASTVAVILHVGATPVLADVDLSTGNVSAKEIARRVTKRTKAIVPVHFAGLPCEMPLIEKLAFDNGLHIIEDAAHAIGARIAGEHVGAKNDAAFSFYATKNLSTGEGGMLTSNDIDFIDYCRKLSLHGMSRDAWKRYQNKGSWFYAIEHLGFKYNCPDLMAVLGRKQLARLDDMNTRRQALVARYDKAFENEPLLLDFQKDFPASVSHACHLYPVLLNLERLSITRSDFIDRLGEKEIGTSVHFIPIHFHPYFKEVLKIPLGSFPNAEYLYERSVSLPLYPGLSDAECDRVIQVVLETLAECKA